MKQSLLSRFAFELLILVSLWLVTSCSREQEQPTPQITAQKLFITASNITKANQINKLLAYSLTGNRYTQYHYGSFTADGLPGKITQTVLTDAISGVSINGFLDDSSRVKTLYCSYHHVKDSLMLSFKYPNPTTVIVNIYRINWASNYIKLRHRVTLRKTGDSFDVVTTASYHRALKGPESITEAGSMSPIPVALTKGALEADELNPTGVPISLTLLAGKSNLNQLLPTLRSTNALNVTKTTQNTDDCVLSDATVAQANMVLAIAGAVVVAAATGLILGAVGGAIIVIALEVTSEAAILSAFQAGGFFGALVAGYRRLHAAGPQHIEGHFENTPADTPNSPETQTTGTQLQRLKIFTGIGSSTGYAAIPALGVCCSGAYICSNGLMQFNVSNGQATGSVQYTSRYTDCNGGILGIANVHQDLLKVSTGSGSNVTIQFGSNTRYIGTLNSQGGEGILECSDGFSCPASNTPFVGVTAKIPTIIEAVN